jgi:hypothetical protein
MLGSRLGGDSFKSQPYIAGRYIYIYSILSYHLLTNCLELFQEVAEVANDKQKWEIRGIIGTMESHFGTQI